MNLTSLIKTSGEYISELKRLSEMEIEANRGKAALAKTDATTAEAQARLSELCATLDLVRVRRGKLDTPVGEVFRDISATLAMEISNWNRKVTALREATERKIVAANSQFFGGDEQRTARYLLRQSRAPFNVLVNVDRCSRSNPTGPEITLEQLHHAAQAFLSHQKRCAKQFPELS